MNKEALYYMMEASDNDESIHTTWRMTCPCRAKPQHAGSDSPKTARSSTSALTLPSMKRTIPRSGMDAPGSGANQTFSI